MLRDLKVISALIKTSETAPWRLSHMLRLNSNSKVLKLDTMAHFIGLELNIILPSDSACTTYYFCNFDVIMGIVNGNEAE